MAKSKAHKKRNPIANEIWTNRVYHQKVITDKKRKSKDEINVSELTDY